MQAIRYAQFGGPEVLSLDEVPIPEPGPGQVRVSVRAAGVNPADSKMRRGFFSRKSTLDAPAGVGFELAGVVEALGEGVEELKAGQAVVALVGSGALATQAVAAVTSVVPLPDGLDFQQAATLPMAAETSVRALRYLDVKAGQTLLVHAAAGAVGLAASQLAIARGLTVVGTASEQRHEFLRELGVRPVRYGDGLAERVREAAPDGVDVVLDGAGRGVLPMSVELTGDPRRVVTIADGTAADHGVHFSSGGAEAVPLAEALAEVLPLIEAGRFRIPIARAFPLAEAADAHRLSEEGHLLGKIIITL